MTPSEMLFNDPKTSVFKNQAELARLLTKCRNSSYYGGKESTIRSLLSKTLRGDRRPTTKFKKSLEAILEKSDMDGSRVQYLKEHLFVSLDKKHAEVSRLNKSQVDGAIKLGFFSDLEFNKSNVSVDCITANLNWAHNHLDSILNAAMENDNKYRYLVADREAMYFAQQILDQIDERKLKKQVQIRFMFKHIGFLKLDDSKERIYVGDKMFPLLQDLVIYRNLPDDIRKFLETKEKEIVVVGTRNDDIDQARDIHDFVELDGARVRLAIDWFNTMWKACGEES